VVVVGAVAVFLFVNVRVSANEHRRGWAEQVTEAQVAAHARVVSQRAAELGLTDPLIMTPDVGGAVYDDDLRILDCAGLLDEQVALDYQSYPALQVYGLQERRPDVIDFTSAYSYQWQLDESALRNAGYLRIAGASQPTGAPADGTFVRRDLLVAPEAPSPIAALANAALDGIDLPTTVEAGGSLTVRTSWSRGRAGGTIVMTLLAPTGANVTSASVSLGASVVDPTAWPLAEAVRHHATLAVPSTASPGAYAVEVALDGQVVVRREVELVTGGTTAAARDTTGTAADEPRSTLERLADELVARPSARAAITAETTQVRTTALSTLRADALTALGAHDTNRLVELGAAAAAARGRQQPAGDDQALARQLAHAPAQDDHERWLLLRAASSFDPTDREVSARLAKVRLALFPAQPRPPANQRVG
jgi:hypothetical protein